MFNIAHPKIKQVYNRLCLNDSRKLRANELAYIEAKNYLPQKLISKVQK